MTSVEAQERDHLDVPTHPPRFKQRIPTPPLSTGWRWGFPILLVAAITWSALLVAEGFNQVLESEEGATLDVITDVTAPGFEAFVEQTWSLLVVSEDDEGQLTGVTVLVVTVGLLVVGMGTLTVLQRTLVDEVDRQLLQVAEEQVPQSPATFSLEDFASFDELTPSVFSSQFYFGAVAGDGVIIDDNVGSASRDRAPDVSRLTADYLERSNDVMTPKLAAIGLAAKFAVKGFTEALITDLRLNAPHVKASVVMPGHIGTNIAINSGKAHGQDPMSMPADEVARLRERELPAALCLHGPDWHEGVVGILASRVKESVHRPVIAFAPAREKGMLKGSGRSIPGLHLRDVLDAVATAHPEMLHKFGGHAMAAGMTLRADHLPAFTEAFQDAVAAVAGADLFDEVVETDGALEEADLCLDTAELLSHRFPWGQGFPPPRFDGEFEVLDSRVVGERHLKLTLGLPGCGGVVDGIHFNADLDQLGDRLRRVYGVYRLEVNEFRGNRNPQLLFEHLRPA
jgi:NAD(P)-dependent dehydrogenase (short-subunit alcohol dehydrogenase family)